MARILSTIAANLDQDILEAALPLLNESRVDALEWSFDTLFRVEEIPEWFTDLLEFYSGNGRLIGHGVFFSLFSGRWSDDQSEWLRKLEQTVDQFPFDHLTEHFGFMTGNDFHHGAPLPIPYNKTTVAIGRDRLNRLANACKCPVGLENLAFSYSPGEVKLHGQFLQELVEPVNGFIILDLHNIYCQLQNFGIQFRTLLALYPLDRVREIHISGGSWAFSSVNSERKIRRDTHDESVPEEVFEMLKQSIPQCPNLKYVVLEQIGTGLKTDESKKDYYNDFIRMQDIVETFNRSNNLLIKNDFTPIYHPPDTLALEDLELHAQQMQLSDILESSSNALEASQRLQKSSLNNSDWKIQEWTPYMIETALRIAQKWA